MYWSCANDPEAYKSQTKPNFFWFLYRHAVTECLCRLHFWYWYMAWHLAGKGWTQDPFLQWANEIHTSHFLLLHCSPFSKAMQIHGSERDGTESRVTKSVVKIFCFWHSLFSKQLHNQSMLFVGFTDLVRELKSLPLLWGKVQSILRLAQRDVFQGTTRNSQMKVKMLKYFEWRMSHLSKF